MGKPDEVYLHLYHGRLDPKQDMEEFGTDGPLLGPFKTIQFTYRDSIRCMHEDDSKHDDFWLAWNSEQLIEHEGVYYRDCSVHSVIPEYLKKETECLTK